MIAHQEGLLQEMIEWMIPWQRLDAGDKRRRVTNQHHHIKIEAPREPFRGHQRKRIAKQWAMAANAIKLKPPKVPHHPGRVARLLHCPDLLTYLVAELKGLFDLMKVLFFVVLTNVVVPVGKSGRTSPGTAKNVERLLNIADQRRRTDDPPHPGSPGSVRPGYEYRTVRFCDSQTRINLGHDSYSYTDVTDGCHRTGPSRARFRLPRSHCLICRGNRRSFIAD